MVNDRKIVENKHESLTLCKHEIVIKRLKRQTLRRRTNLGSWIKDIGPVDGGSGLSPTEMPENAKKRRGFPEIGQVQHAHCTTVSASGEGVLHLSILRRYERRLSSQHVDTTSAIQTMSITSFVCQREDKLWHRITTETINNENAPAVRERLFVHERSV